LQDFRQLFCTQLMPKQQKIGKPIVKPIFRLDYYVSFLGSIIKVVVRDRAYKKISKK